MPLLAAVAAAAAVWAFRGGVAGAPNWWLAVAWTAGVAALHLMSVMVLLWSDTDWDDPSSPNRLGSLGEPMVAAAALALSVSLALVLRRRAVAYLALAILPLLVWHWIPVFN